MNKPFIEIDAENFTIASFIVKPIEGYELPKNEITGEDFPYCCEFHKKIFEDSKSWFNKFPYCCKSHEAMVGKWWFNKNNYSGLPEKIVKQVSFTEYHISKQIDIPEWYKDITDYIEYNTESFGHPAIGLHIYLDNVRFFIQNAKRINLTPQKREKLVDYINGYYNLKTTKKTDFNILYLTYQKWLKIFPFEISYFNNLKQKFENELPFINGKPEENIYSGKAKGKVHTKSSLVEALLNITNYLLTQINGAILYEKGLITDANKIKLELIINNRKLKLKEGYNNKSRNEEQRYRKILKEWFIDEKKFIDELTPLLNLENDCDFIKGQIIEEFTPQGDTGFFAITKDKSKRIFTIEKYFDLELRNWEFEIDKVITKSDKIQLVNNAIFKFSKVLVSETHPLIKSTIEGKINHLKIIKEYINSSFNENLPPKTKTEKIKNELSKYGFFELPAVKTLSEENKGKLVELINTKGLPYCIAMFDYLRFLNHLEIEHFKSKYELHREVAQWFNSDKGGRAVKGNINSLLKNSKENKKRYTAYQHKETVQKDYQKLK